MPDTRNDLKKSSFNNLYTLREEIANGITHGLGIIFGIVALIILVALSIDKKSPLSIIAFSIYGTTIILMYLCSTLYHSIIHIKAKRILRVFDHSSIYLFIAGTYTPIALLAFRGYLRIGILAIVWTIAILGVLFKIITYKKIDKFNKLSLSIYLLMGWISILTIKPIITVTSIQFFIWLLSGGLLYSLGTIFYSKKTLPYSHAIWHVFVLGASIVQFLGIFIYLT